MAGNANQRLIDHNTIFFFQVGNDITPPRQDELIRTRAAGQRIVAGITVECVVITSAIQDILTVVSLKVVVSTSTINRVIAGITDQLIAFFATIDRIIAAAAVDRVVA